MSLVSSWAKEDPYEIGKAPFYAKALKIEWKVPAERLPKTVTLIAVHPQTFSDSVVSNALLLGSLTFSNRVEPHLKTKGAYLFENDGETLSIAPSLATISYSCEDSEIHRDVILPSAEEVREIALKLLPRLEIDPAQTQTVSHTGKPIIGYDSRWRSYFDKIERQHVRQLYARGISFPRIYENIPFHHEGLSMEVGDNGQVLRLNLNWQNLQPSGIKPVAPPDQLMKWIKEGRARVSSSVATGMQMRNVSHVEKLTIKDTAVWYFDFDAETNRRQKVIHPFGVFEANAEMQEGVDIPITLYCPIVSAHLPKAKRDSDSTFYFWPANHPVAASTK